MTGTVEHNSARYALGWWAGISREPSPLRLSLFLLLAIGLWAGTVEIAEAFTTNQQEDICAQSWVLFCENFEDRTVATSSPGIQDLSRAKFKNPGWALSYPGGMGVSTTLAYDGSKSFVLNYPAVSVPWPNVDAGSTNFMTSLIQSSGTGVRDLYYRWYTRWGTGWVQSPVSEKHFEIDGGFVGHIWQGLFKSPAPVFTTQLSSTNVNWTQNQGSSSVIGDPQWHCFEVHVRMNSTSNSTDGLLEGWIDGALRLSANNVNVSSQRTTQSELLVGGYWNCLDNGNGCTNDPANNHPAMSRYHDNIVIGTQRIGCLGTQPPSGDTTPPASPSGLRVSGLWQWVMSWMVG